MIPLYMQVELKDGSRKDLKIEGIKKQEIFGGVRFDCFAIEHDRKITFRLTYFINRHVWELSY